MLYPNIAARIFNQPLLVSPDKAVLILSALAPRLGVEGITLPGGEFLGQTAMAEVLEADAVNDPGTRTGRQGRLFDSLHGIAYIPIEGSLANKTGDLDPRSGVTGYDGIAAKVAAAAADPTIKGILLDIDSPGGEVAGLAELTDLIFESRADQGGKTIWATAADMATSAAYMIAAAADAAFVSPAGQVGSIGVVVLHVDTSKALEKRGLNVTMIYAGAHKVDGNPFVALSDAVHADFQSKVDFIYDLATAQVGKMRKGFSQEQARATEARVYLGQEAVDAGLVDDVATPREVVGAMIESL